MRFLFATVLIASLSTAGLAQTAAPAAAKPAAAKPAAKKPAAAKPAAHSKREAAELAVPLEDADPSDKLTPAELEIAKRVYVGEIPCELGAKVVVNARKREGYLLV